MSLHIRGEMRIVTCQTDDIDHLGPEAKRESAFSIYVNACFTRFLWNERN